MTSETPEYSADAASNPTPRTVPPPTSENVRKVQRSLHNVHSFLLEYSTDFQTRIETLYDLAQVSSADPGNKLANVVTLLASAALAYVPGVGPGASVIIGGVFNIDSNDPSNSNLNSEFATVWKRFQETKEAADRTTVKYSQYTAENWTTPLENPMAPHGQKVLADLVLDPFPEVMTTEFHNLLYAFLESNRYQLWKQMLKTLWQIRTPKYGFGSDGGSQPPTFNSEAECMDYIRARVSAFPYLYIPCEKLWLQDRWEAIDHSLVKDGDEMPEQVRNELFKDDPLGTILRPTSVAMHQDVYTNWGIGYV